MTTADVVTEAPIACDAVELAHMIASGHVSAVEAMRTALDRLLCTEPTLSAFSHLMCDEALAASARADRQRAEGSPLPPLFGVPVAIDELIAVEGAPWTHGCRAFNDQRSPTDSPAVARLRAAGAIIIGKTASSELDCKAVGSSVLHPGTRNPWGQQHTAGGSAGGAAAAVAAGVVPIAIGTDGGGSVRVAAALTGVVGFKAQFGRVPVFPHTATPELTHVAPIARSVRDVALLLQVMAGHDSRDPGSLMQVPPNFVRAVDVVPRKLRLAWSPTFGHARTGQEAIRIAEAVVSALERAGCDIELVEAPIGPDPAAAWAQLFYAQVAAHFGELLQRHPNQIDPALVPLLRSTARRTALTHVRALAARHRIFDRLSVLFERCDVLISPTLPVTEVELGADIPPGFDTLTPVSWASYTFPFTLTGHPAASLPAGRTRLGLPVGVHLVGKPGRETELLNLCAAIETLRPWSRVAPWSTQPATTPRHQSSEATA